MSHRDRSNHVIISVNPLAGSTSSDAVIRQAKLAIQSRGFQVQAITSISEVVAKAEQLFQQGLLQTVIAAGGDGTIALLANHLSSEIPLTLLPLGTENLMAKYFSLTNSAEEIADVVSEARTMQIDSGLANGKRFLLMASCGFDADVVTRLHQQRSGHIRHSSYAKPIWKSIRKYKYPELLIYSDDHAAPIKARWAFVFNLPCYAMGLPIIPTADATDGKFDLCTFRGGNLFNGLIYLFGVIARQHRGWRDTHFGQITKLRVESDSEVPYQIDGDPGGNLPLEISVEPKSITIMLPKQAFDTAE